MGGTGLLGVGVAPAVPSLPPPPIPITQVTSLEREVTGNSRVCRGLAEDVAGRVRREGSQYWSGGCPLLLSPLLGMWTP